MAKNNKLKWIAIVILIILGLAVAAFFGKDYFFLPQTKVLVPTPPPVDYTLNIEGEITNVSNTHLSITTRAGKTGDLPLSSDLKIYKNINQYSQATPSSDLKSIELKKQAVVIMEPRAGDYQVVSIIYP